MPPRGGDAGAAVVDPARSVLWAAADLRAGGAGWYERMAAVTALATPTLAWPDLCSPGQAGGCGTVGHSPLVTARVWAAVRAGLLAEGQGVGVLPGWPAAWLGRALEVHGLPSAFGAVSFAVRWHGARPALLWAVAGGPDDLVVTAPVLDPAWRGSGPSGEALLAAPAGGPVAEGTVQ
jgi:hypothetical protein